MPRKEAPVSFFGLALLFLYIGTALIKLHGRSLTINTALAALIRALTYPLRSRRAPTFSKDVIFAAIRAMLYRITIPQSRYLNPTTAQRYLEYCSKYGIEAKTIEVENLGEDGVGRVAAQWIGDPEAKFVLLFLHGGGYIQSSTEGYYEYWHGMINRTNASNATTSVAVLQLDYTLAPEARYPTQLQEAATVLSYLLSEAERPPSSIILIGDSAGGNLCLSLVSHLLHPQAEVPAISLDEPLLGLLLYSPWVSFRTNSESFSRNAGLDVLEATMLRRWAAMYLGKSKDNPEDDPGPVFGDCYSEPLSNGAGWWTGTHRIARDVLVVSGENEIFADDLSDFFKLFKKGWRDGGAEAERALSIQAAGRVHIDPIISVTLSPNEKGEDQAAVEEWLRACLGT